MQDTIYKNIAFCKYVINNKDKFEKAAYDTWSDKWIAFQRRGQSITDISYYEGGK